MLSSAVAELLEQAEAQLAQIKDLFEQDSISPEVVRGLLDEHQQLFSHFFSVKPQLSSEEKTAIGAHVKQMQALYQLSAELKQQVERQMGTLKRSKLINKAYGKSS